MKKILVIQQKMIGDVLTSSILFEVLRKAYPDAQLDYLINTSTAAVVENNPNIDTLIFFTKKEEQSKKALLHFAKKIALNQYDVIIDVYSKLSSNLISLYSNASIKISSFKWYSSWIYTHTIKNIKASGNTKNLALKNRLLLLNPLNLSNAVVKPLIYLTPKEITKGKTLLEANSIDFKRPIYMISILGSSKNKTYPFEYMAILLNYIVKTTKGQILFNYIPNQINDVKQIFNLCDRKTQAHIHLSIFGKTLREFLTLTYHCSALIGNEGGAINMAKAINIPTFSIFSPWIDKEVWSLFENQTTNTSVHLKDFKPKLYSKNSLKKIKKRHHFFYQKFEPEIIEKKLSIFLKSI